jgi:hypothetical protein
MGLTAEESARLFFYPTTKVFEEIKASTVSYEDQNSKKWPQL